LHGCTRDNLSDETVQAGVGGALDVERMTAKIVQSFIVKNDSDIHVLEQGAAIHHHVVRLNDGVGKTQKPRLCGIYSGKVMWPCKISAAMRCLNNNIF
jgi:hypothetical protein